MDTSNPFDTWLDDFLATFFRQNPVDATFIGMHDHDHELPDCSPEGIEQAKDELRGLQDRLSAFPTDGLSVAQKLDHRLAAGFIEIRLWELGSGHFAGGNPSYYTGEAIFGIIGLFQRDAEPFADRVAAAIARMQAIPAFLTRARSNIASAPTAWTERAMRECRSALIYFGSGLRTLATERSIVDRAFLAAADGAHAAFTEHLAWLEGTLLTNPNESYASGRVAFERYLTAGHCLPAEQTAGWILATAREAMATAQAELESRAAAIDSNKSWQEQLAGLADLHPTAEEYYSTYGRVWQEAKDAAVAADLVTWPDFPIEFVPFPASDREAAAGLYYLFYRCPPALGYHDSHSYLVTPVEPRQMAPEEQERRLRATNDSVIKLNHVVHHGGLGHHVQNWNAFRAETRIGRIAGTDAASRIAFFCAGTLVEGWACYATDLAEEIGFLTPLEALSEQQSRARMAARAIADVSIHTGQMTLAEAAAFYEREAGMSAAAAHGEAVKNSMFPGAAMMYLSGTSAIHALRQQLSARDGAAFNLRAFHDHFLSYGAVPVALIAEEMLG